MDYGQFCPISKAVEILGDKWTLLIVRELLMGGRHYSELQRGLIQISPTMLSKRLDSLERIVDSAADEVLVVLGKGPHYDVEQFAGRVPGSRSVADCLGTVG